MKTITLAIVFLLFPFLINAQSVATYNITFTNFWNETDHSISTTFPNDAHWSKLVGANHNSSVTFLEMNGNATLGIENIAEDGNNDQFKNNEVIPNVNAEQYIDGDGLTLSSGNIIEIIGLEVSAEYPLLTLVSMIAPSPDWMIAINGINLRNLGNTAWQNSIIIDLFPYDAGTEDGSTYSTSNSESIPKGTITSIQSVAPFNNEKVARLTIELQSVLDVDNNTLNKARIFPNPSNGNVTISNIQNVAIDLVEIFNGLGKKVYNQNIQTELSSMSINLETLNSGVYFLKIRSSKGHTKTQKLVLQ